MVRTRGDVDTIFSAKKRYLKLKSLHMQHIRAGNTLEAIKIRNEMDQIRNEIREKYNIIL